MSSLKKPTQVKNCVKYMYSRYRLSTQIFVLIKHNMDMLKSDINIVLIFQNKNENKFLSNLK